MPTWAVQIWRGPHLIHPVSPTWPCMDSGRQENYIKKCSTCFSLCGHPASNNVLYPCLNVSVLYVVYTFLNHSISHLKCCRCFKRILPHLFTLNFGTGKQLKSTTVQSTVIYNLPLLKIYLLLLHILTQKETSNTYPFWEEVPYQLPWKSTRRSLILSEPVINHHSKLRLETSM